MDLKEFTLKERKLEETKDRLKAQFFGLDKVIDQLIDSLRTWYHIPHFQTRPLVINLWGSAGVGKSKLVEDLIELLELEFSSLKIKPKDWNTSDVLESLSSLQIAKFPVRAIFCVDDFQSFFKKNKSEYPWDRPENNLLWELLDQGIIKSPKKNSHELDILEAISKGLSYMVRSGLKIENGFVEKELSKQFIANKKFWEYDRASTPKNWADWVGSDPENQFVFNYQEAKLLFDSGYQSFDNLENFIAHLKTLNQDEILDLVNLSLQKSLQFNKVDLSQSLFFVIGNLEELEIQETNPNNMYSGINSPDQVREILSYQLPTEFIARLGNNHIFIPKPVMQEFKQIIKKELASIQSKFNIETGSTIEFENTVIDWLLGEGVIPGLGIRPVFSTIQYAIVDNLPAIMLGLINNKNKADKVTISMDRGLDVKYWKGEKSILQSWHPIPSRNKRTLNSEGLNQNPN